MTVGGCCEAASRAEDPFAARKSRKRRLSPLACECLQWPDAGEQSFICCSCTELLGRSSRSSGAAAKRSERGSPKRVPSVHGSRRVQCARLLYWRSAWEARCALILAVRPGTKVVNWRGRPSFFLWLWRGRCAAAERGA